MKAGRSRLAAAVGHMWCSKISVQTCPSSVRIFNVRVVKGFSLHIYLTLNKCSKSHLTLVIFLRPLFSPVGSNLVTAAAHFAQHRDMKALLFSAVCHRLHSALLPPCFWWRSHISKSPFHKFLPAVLFSPLHFHVLPLKLLCSASSSALWVKLINGGSLANVLCASFSAVTDQSHCSHFLTHLVGFYFVFTSQIHIHTHSHTCLYFYHCEAFNRHELFALTLTPTFYPNLQPRLMAGLLRTIKVSLVVGLNHRSAGQVQRHSG